ncbi:hypothetical protein D9O36_06000 [Zobellia amurskyensis]|uniref:Uncharacterized protein n=1 Tax=Zobellia amurskyensis TaxID=248905 RepID=A0A7X2ZS49_9FLAO|nr:hypothetical protein [Zobellia amurskyensis]MUH35385.1 hypothetical protein [Zobellia amurskyensis]
MKLKIIVLLISFFFVEHLHAQSAMVTDVADLIGNNDIISVKIDKEEYRLNPNGQLSLARGNILTDSIIYNENGNIKTVYTFASEEPREKIIIKYDENELLIAADYFVPLNNKDYLVNSLIFESKKKTPDGIIKNYKFKDGDSTLEFHFNNQGLMEKKITIHPSHGYYWQEEIEYNDFSEEKRKRKKEPI